MIRLSDVVAWPVQVSAVHHGTFSASLMKFTGTIILCSECGLSEKIMKQNIMHIMVTVVGFANEAALPSCRIRPNISCGF